METASQNDFVPFVCPHCHQEIEATREMAGQSAECPACGAHLSVPEVGAASTPAQLDAMKSRTIRIELPEL